MPPGAQTDAQNKARHCNRGERIYTRIVGSLITKQCHVVAINLDGSGNNLCVVL